jgi:hypothetical protein
MIDFRYAYYLFFKYLPLGISSFTGAYLVYYLFLDNFSDIEGIKFMLLSSLFASCVGWGTVFLAEERLRKLMLASHSLIRSIETIIEETKSEDRDEV